MAPDEMRIQITSVKHADSNLFMAFSDELPGLLVSGRTGQDIEDKLPDAITEILEAQGRTVLSVTASRDEDHIPESFGPPAFIADAALQAAV